MSIVAKTKIVRDFLIDDFELKGNSTDYYNEENSFLDFVLATRLGIPLTLCIVFACVARRVGIATHLVGLPGHVVLGFRDEDEIMHYLDVFHAGTSLTLAGCQTIVESYGISWDARMARPLNPSEVNRRILRNLAHCFMRRRNATINQSQSIQPHEYELSFQRRLLGLWLNGEDVRARDISITTNLRLSKSLVKEYGLL